MTKKLLSRRDIKRFFYNTLIRKYDVTTSFLSRLLWPSSVIFIVTFLAPEIRNILDSFATSLEFTTSIKYGDLEFIVDRDFFESTDLEAFGIIQEMSQQELVVLIERAKSTFVLENALISEEEKNAFLSLEERELITFVDEFNREVEISEISEIQERVTEIRPTDRGIDVYDEIQRISLHFIRKLPKEEKESEN